MHRIDSTDNTPSLPAPLAPGTPGFFATGTTVRRDWLNSTQEELCNAAELVDTLDKNDNTQVARAIQAAVVGGAVSVAGATTEHSAAVAVSEDSSVTGDRSLVCASFETSIGGDRSAAAATTGVTMDALSERSFAGASTDTTFTDTSLCASIASEQDTLEETYGSAALAGNSNLIQYGSNHLIAAGDSNMIQALVGSAIIASHESQIAPGSPAPSRCVVMASRNCAVEYGTANTTADGGSSTGGRTYVVAGGWASGGVVAPTWRLESQGGIVRAAVHAVGGLDYAELFENGDGVPQRPGRIQTRRGAKAHLAQPGDRILGPVSSTPSIVGGEDGIAWAGRYERDKWGAPVLEEVDASQTVLDPEAIKAWKAQRAALSTARRAARQAGDKKRVRELRAELRTLAPPAQKTITERVQQRKLNSNWDPKREQLSRRSRPAEWTVVGLLGQVRIAIGPDVAEGDALMPGKDGLGVTATREYLLDGVALGGARLEVMQIVEPYSAEAGEGVALCLVR